MSSIFVSDTPFTQQGDIKVPRELRALFDKDGFGTGTSLTFDYDGKRVIIMDSALYALKEFQEGMKGKAEEAGLMTEEDCDNVVFQNRRASDQK